jgi:hypothetical protein
MTERNKEDTMFESLSIGGSYFDQEKPEISVGTDDCSTKEIFKDLVKGGVETQTNKYL